LDIEYIFNFITLVEEKNFIKAADKLFMSQSSLSRQINKLENELGIHLINHKKRTVELTKAGKICLAEFKEIAEVYNRMNTKISEIKSGYHGSLKICYYETLEFKRIANALCCLNNKYPQLKSYLYNEKFSQHISSLMNDETDIIVTLACETDKLENVEYETLLENKLKIVVPNNHKLAQKKSVSFSDLKNEKFIAYNQKLSPGFHDCFVNMCINHGFYPNVVKYAKTMEDAIVYAGMGIGICLGTTTSKAKSLKLTHFLDVEAEDDTNKFNWVMAWKKNNPNPFIKLYIQELLN